jgi:hypothetical protein
METIMSNEAVAVLSPESAYAYSELLRRYRGLLVVLLGNVKFITSHISKIANLQKLREISFQASSAF